ncbi:hypothetical protein TNCV_3520781 [Trichonephila clavipes]|nr:hypothetical protein TNCV_3520781 [Trichonephila clavipes]
MPSPVQSNCDAHDTIANGSTVLSGQWDTHNRSPMRHERNRLDCIYWDFTLFDGIGLALHVSRAQKEGCLSK